MARKKLPPELKAKNHTFKLYDWEVEAVKKYIQYIRKANKCVNELENNPDVHTVRIENIEVKEIER
jgi:hypothetical protein